MERLKSAYLSATRTYGTVQAYVALHFKRTVWSAVHSLGNNTKFRILVCLDHADKLKYSRNM